MTEINQKIKKRLEIICDQFIEEKIGTTKLKLMPPKNKVPIISKLHYEKSDDAFEIYFDECDDYRCKPENNIDFLEDKSGHLMAIRIRNFSRLDIEGIRLSVLTSIENEIKSVTMETTTKLDILNNVIDKRKLMFLDSVVKQDYKELKKEYVK
jgi:hypothetical protein